MAPLRSDGLRRGLRVAHVEIPREDGPINAVAAHELAGFHHLSLTRFGVRLFGFHVRRAHEQTWPSSASSKLYRKQRALLLRGGEEVQPWLLPVESRLPHGHRDTVLLALPCSPTVGRSDDVEVAGQSSLQPVGGVRRHLL